jgi:hypothetical protein
MTQESKIIWMCWFQGKNSLDSSSLQAKCIKQWMLLNPDWTVHILNNNTISNFVPEYWEIKNQKFGKYRKPPADSDLLRLLLLSKFGGVWADATVFPTLPLTAFYSTVVNNKTGFFCYRFIERKYNAVRGNKDIASWFLCTNTSNHPLIDEWKKIFINEYITTENNSWKYFTLHHVLAELYDVNEEIKWYIDNTIQISEQIPHSAVLSNNLLYDSYMYKKPCKEKFERINELVKQKNDMRKTVYTLL